MALDANQRFNSADDHMDTPDGPFWQAEGRQLSPSGREASGYIRSELAAYNDCL